MKRYANVTLLERNYDQKRIPLNKIRHDMIHKQKFQHTTIAFLSFKYFITLF